ncbi:unnamed protein product, partial [Amoebophrya sp. A25]
GAIAAEQNAQEHNALSQAFDQASFSNIGLTSTLQGDPGTQANFMVPLSVPAINASSSSPTILNMNSQQGRVQQGAAT